MASKAPTVGGGVYARHNNRPRFMSYGLSGGLADWGWVYQTQNNGTWINASSGNSGNITG